MEEEGCSMGVDCRQDVVQDESCAPRIKSPGERDASLLSAGAGRALLADLSLIAKLKDLEVALELAGPDGREVARLVPTNGESADSTGQRAMKEARTNQGEPKTMFSLTDAPTSQGCCEQ